MKAIVIGISGGTSSGKSTFAKKLLDDLQMLKIKCKLVEMDHYYYDIPGKVLAPFTNIEYDEHNHPDSINKSEILQVITMNMDEYELIIVEGIFSFYYPEIRLFLDFKIYIDLLSDERLIRRIKRGIIAWKQDMNTIANRYLDTVRYRHDEFVEPTRWYADIVINGNNMTNNAFNSVKLNILELVKNRNLTTAST